MPKNYFIFNNGKSVVPGGMYELDDAENIAKHAAMREPGKTFTVMQKITEFRHLKEKK